MAYNSPKLLIEKLSKLLEKRGAKSEFCRKTGISRSLLEKWLGYDSSPGMESIDKIASALGTTPWDLVRPHHEAVVPIELYVQVTEAMVQKEKEYEAQLRRFERLTVAQDQEIEELKRKLPEQPSPVPAGSPIENLVAALLCLNESQLNTALFAIRGVLDGLDLTSETGVSHSRNQRKKLP